MKKLAQIVTALAFVLSAVLVPVSVHAQVDPIPVGDELLGDPTGLPSTGATPETPDTGIAPNSRVGQTLALFVMGSLLGAGVAFGAIKLHNKQQ